MATHTPTLSQGAGAAAAAAAGPPDNTHETQGGVSSRRLKKREIDRRCQRQARERTKSRIAYLEGLVEEFRRQDSSGQVATLLKQLKEVESERDLMAKTLKDIQKAMQTHKPLNKPMVEEEVDDKSSVLMARMAYDEASVERRSSVTPLRDDAPLAFQQPEAVEIQQSGTSPARNFELATFSPTPSLPLQCQDLLFAPEVVPLQSDGTHSPSQVMVQAKGVKEQEPNPMPSSWNDNWAVPRHSCSCHSCHDRKPGRRSVWRGNYWAYANEVLSERFDWNDEVAPESDDLCDDVPIRALIEGWDAVAKRAPLHPSWKILRRIDETLFAMCPNTERLAIMRAMHTLLQFHTSSTFDRYARLPPWYMRRPSQKIAHSYAIDYFAWPGVRERFIFNEHDYCGNEFWHLFCKSLRILWPYEFRDCYTREIETGLYKFSPMFDQRLRDIKSWTMGPDIFNRFPELYSDMPAFNNIPQSPCSSTGSLMPAQVQPPAKKARLLPPSPSPRQTQTQRGYVIEEEEEEVKPPPAGSQFIPVENLHSHVVQTPQQQAHQEHHRQQSHHHGSTLNPHSYNPADFNPIMALDAFSYGGISDADFASAYHSELIEGYPNLIF
ncbi:uncharacterized protein Z520_02430 [Fonsecaea multimorphosa CBS 102226]|uniref:BZIP domain-containing protein n=1 Tax=Fonsecaea multimorphosa CBS 102226 TaxID=1442371 RepID=A0A0D2IZ22_9EURO|nr:uncharacterized protein Z520_02430 [Fonsecaea multimorphosa CBS 102226]KIY02292.1 hypothetical protein Z520_02430 [Fonsecaea multimorphosa CBS 102226]OAL28939.1 hypothetical protein AYO22_02375 [Fonsecaea multimorphosa]